MIIIDYYDYYDYYYYNDDASCLLFFNLASHSSSTQNTMASRDDNPCIIRKQLNDLVRLM